MDIIGKDHVGTHKQIQTHRYTTITHIHTHTLFIFFLDSREYRQSLFAGTRGSGLGG